MATLKIISAALKLVDVKKENLKKAFEDLQSHSSSLSSFNLTWSDLDSYFTSLQSSLQHNFNLLQSQSQSQPQPQPQSQQLLQIEPQSQSPKSSVIVNSARPELKSFCENMDGLGLRKYMIERPKVRNSIRVELPDALRGAPDAAAMVLDAMEGFYVANSKGDKDFELCTVRRCCVVLLEELQGLKVEIIRAEVKVRAMKLAAEWKGKVSVGGENPLEALAFLHLLAAYGLADGFDVEELLEFAVIAAKFRQATELCRVLGFGDKISDLIIKLISKGKQLLAVKFIFEFDLADKFPPVPLLKEHVKESKKLAQKVFKGGKNSFQSQNEAATKEVCALKSVVKVIEDHKLESEYPTEKLMKRIETLEKLKADKKRAVTAPVSMIQQQSKPQEMSGTKRPRITANSTVLASQQSQLQPAGLLPEPHAPYSSSLAGLYGLAGSTSAVPYAGSSAGLYDSARAPLGIPGNVVPTQPHVNPSESHLPSSYFDRPIAYGGYGLPPQYHLPYYPQ
ncbi:unnamed protein product [Camellia sinensis]